MNSLFINFAVFADFDPASVAVTRTRAVTGVIMALVKMSDFFNEAFSVLGDGTESADILI